MKTQKSRSIQTNSADTSNERGSAIVISLFVLALISVFVAMALTRTSAEAAAVGNETAEGRTFYAAQGSLEMMTRNFNKVFETKLNPSTADLNDIRNSPVLGLGANYTFVQELDPTSTRQNVVLTGGPYSGLYAIRDNWRLRTTATDNVGVQVQLTRHLLNSRVPIFQFGVFYEDDLELFNGPTFGFGGRVHTNRHFFLHPSDNGAYFDSRVTAAGHIVTQTKRNGEMPNISSALVQIKNASGVYQQLLPTEGSVLNGSPSVLTPELPSSVLNNNFAAQTAKFDGNLQAQTRVLKLPLKLGNTFDLVEMLKRPKVTAGAAGGDLYRDNTGTVAPVTAAVADGDIMQSERYSNKPGIRISLADSKARLPGCASGAGTTPIAGACGIRLDGSLDGQGDRATTGCLPGDRANPCVRGYRPRPMKNAAADVAFNHQATRVNGERFFMGSLVAGREVWIKVELVAQDAATNAIITTDITQDFLSLGITEQATVINDSGGTARFDITDTRYTDTGCTISSITATAAQTANTCTDSRSIIKLQRFIVKGPQIPNSATPYTSWVDMAGGIDYNVAERYTGVNQTEINGGCASGCTAADAEPVLDTTDAINERDGHMFLANINGNTDRAIAPFPITMFDQREGEYYDERSNTYYTDLTRLPRNGVMSMIDIDVANLRRFFRGDFDGLFPTTTPAAIAFGGVGLRSTNVPQREGWVIYVSDRRGDVDHDGELDMEDIYSAAPGNGGTTQPGEDVNNDGILNTSYGTSGETERYNTTPVSADLAAVSNHQYYRRGVRLTNAATIPGIYDSATPANTRGVSFASENGIYTLGNFNATGIGVVPATGNSTYDQYLPFNTATHIPASIVGDAVTILSNGWLDAASFSTPITGPTNHGGRQATDTQIRFAMIAGDTITSLVGNPHQGGTDERLNGGVHNFKRFLEDWGGNRLDYTGSLINLFNSRNNNGSFKCCNTVYSPPRRNWVFDSTFLDPTRLPPGTPFFQYVQTTGFQRTND